MTGPTDITQEKEIKYSQGTFDMVYKIQEFVCIPQYCYCATKIDEQISNIRENILGHSMWAASPNLSIILVIIDVTQSSTSSTD